MEKLEAGHSKGSKGLRCVNVAYSVTLLVAKFCGHFT